MSPTQAGTAGTYRYEWALFLDWCAAAEVDPLPATPSVLAEFLGDNPASDAVQVRRVSAVNRAHLDAGHAPPGRVTSLRLALDSARAQRIGRRAAQYSALATGLPSTGLTEALFGRRDALLLLLAGAGLSYRAIAGLDRSDIATDGGSLWIGGSHRIRIDPGGAAAVAPTEVWERWRTILRFSDRYPSTTLIAEHLQANTFPEMCGWPDRPGRVAVPIDRWGHLPLPAAAMTAAEIGAVVHAHRTGIAPQHTPRRRMPRPDELRQGDLPTPVEQESAFVQLDSGYYRTGIEARRRAHTALADVPDLVDDVEDRIEALLQRTLDLLRDESDA